MSKTKYKRRKKKYRLKAEQEGIRIYFLDACFLSFDTIKTRIQNEPTMN
jgi:hypothetical protein